MADNKTISNFLFSVFGTEKASSKFQIVFTIIIHLLGWAVVFFLPLLLYSVRIDKEIFLRDELFDKLSLVVLFYLNYYFLIRRLFEKKKYVTYFLSVAIAFVLYLTQHLMSEFYVFERGPGSLKVVNFSGPKPQNSQRKLFVGDVTDTIRMGVGVPHVRGYTVFAGDAEKNILPDSLNTFFTFPPEGESKIFGIPKGIFLVSLSRCLSSFLSVILIAGFIRLAYSFIRSQNEKRALENAKLNAEVNFLKSQINPHFLFNTLNSIYSQAHLRSAQTEYSILKFSDLLRYVLYDSSAAKVDLSKDVQYLTNYIDLQKIRLSQKVNIRYNISGSMHGKKIAPLLLITFVENAFKHGVSYSSPSTIGVQLNIFEESLAMTVTNPVIEHNSLENNGLGLNNVIRRLDLLYPGKYSLEIARHGQLHTVNLKIDLNHD
jgi:hypothetical protein